jgi:putative oxidoreductase
MFGVRSIARSLLASMFIVGGLDALRRPKQLAPVAEDVAEPVAEQAGIDTSTENLVKINGAVQLGGGAMLALGVLPRPAALALAGTLVPTTLAAHRFWEEEGEARTAQMIHFLKNAGLLGGLLLAALDTGGRPSVFWSTKQAASGAADAVGTTATRVYDAVTPS